MATTNEPVERRKDKRLLVLEAAFVCFDANPAMMARIVDVSTGGLGFTYRASKRRTDDWFTLEILCILYDISLQGIPVRTISDSETTVKGVRRCDIQFERLTEEQKHELEQFIQRCTIEKA
jgi:c-di-GMP-binding flagellar brake protein YcgR